MKAPICAVKLNYGKSCSFLLISYAKTIYDSYEKSNLFKLYFASVSTLSDKKTQQYKYSKLLVCHKPMYKPAGC